MESCGNETSMTSVDLGGRTRGGGNVVRERVGSVDCRMFSVIDGSGEVVKHGSGGFGGGIVIGSGGLTKL